MKASVLISQIKALREKWEPGPAIGIHSQSRWQGPAEIQVDHETWRVFQCNSVLELREKLSDESATPSVLVTPLSQTAIGNDVRARLFKERVFPVDLWRSLAERYKARDVDPVLKQSSILADAALDALGNTDPPIAASGVLTAELIWQVILENRLGLKTAKPDVLDFLPWIAAEGSAERWQSLGPDLQKELAAWLALSLGDLGPVLTRTLADGYGTDAIAVGFVLGALNSPSATDPRALGRLERFTGNQALPTPLALQWNEASEKWARREAPEKQHGRENLEQIRRQLSRADQILETLGASGAAINSRWSPLGFQQRLAAFAEQLVSSDSRKSQQSYALIASHEGSRHLSELRGRRERAEMAMRLCRWLEKPEELAATLEQAVANFESNGSWVDWARHQILAGDEPEGVSRAYRKLFDKVTARREAENRHFSELLVANTASNSPAQGLLMMEHVLSTVLAPLAKVSPAGVLFIVMDGMSLPVWRELSVDLYTHGWQEWTPESSPAYRSALTVIPSATNYSRSSLLCGELVRGAQNLEKRGFQDCPPLRPFKPVLFHKDEVGSSGVELSEALRVAVGKNDPKVVGVVLNVIDDSLGGPEQRSFRWNLGEISVLQTLLSEAKSAGRVVVLASDHGHVLDHGSKLNRKADSADRWRPADADTAPAADELLVKGTRVLAEGGRIIAPISESVRYTANRRLGYHGGLTPQECVAPLAVLAPPLMTIEGWEVSTVAPPDWWDEIPALLTEQPKAKKPAKKKDTRTAALPFLESVSAPADWLGSLLASPVFAEQMATFSGRVKEEQIQQALRILSDRNLVLLKSAFAQKMDIPGLRVDGFIASLQRILNVEGYPVLSVDSSQTIRLNLPMLKEQFEIGASDGR